MREALSFVDDDAGLGEVSHLPSSSLRPGTGVQGLGRSGLGRSVLLAICPGPFCQGLSYHPHLLTCGPFTLWTRSPRLPLPPRLAYSGRLWEKVLEIQACHAVKLCSSECARRIHGRVQLGRPASRFSGAPSSLREALFLAHGLLPSGCPRLPWALTLPSRDARHQREALFDGHLGCEGALCSPEWV